MEIYTDFHIKVKIKKKKEKYSLLEIKIYIYFYISAIYCFLIKKPILKI